MRTFLTLFILILSLSSFDVKAQEGRENPYILICDGNEPEFSIDRYRNCNQVSIRENEMGVKQFVLVIMKRNKREEFPITGDVVSEEALEKIAKQKAPCTIRIEQVKDESDTEVEGFRELIITE